MLEHLGHLRRDAAQLDRVGAGVVELTNDRSPSRGVRTFGHAQDRVALAPGVATAHLVGDGFGLEGNLRQ
ncbi:MAG: hypothetical protein ACYTFV_16040, partial [Planctomycetota bacterium]